MDVGLAQREMPVHVLNEYCHPDRSFYPLPEFNEEILPRSIKFFNITTSSEAALFPLVISDSFGLGVNFTIERGTSNPGALGCYRVFNHVARIDFTAIKHLNEVRNEDLKHSRENLTPTELQHSLGMLY